MLPLGQVTLTSISIVIGIAGGLFAAGVSAFEYRLKARTQRAESDINLARLFSELVPVASGWGKPVLSEAAVSALVENAEFTKDQLRDRCVVAPPAGQNAQIAAIASLGYLGRTYPALRQPATVALEGLDFLTLPSMVAARDSALAQVRDGV